MEHNPSLTPTYLAGKVDEYVKFAARDTIRRNARRDPKCRYARIPDGKACDFCRMLGSRGFVYHGEFEAGGDGNDYHPHCNCQLAVSFDPFIEKYEVVSESGTVTTVTRGYGMEDAELVRPGRDGSYELREVDIDELFDEYKAMGTKFAAKSKYKDYTLGSKLSDEEFADAMRRLSEAKTREELHEIADEILDRWPPNDNGRDRSQWDEMSRLAKELDGRFDDDDILSTLPDAEEKQLVKPRKGDEDHYTVNYDAVNSDEHKEAFRSLPYSYKARKALRRESGKIMQEHDGTAFETMTAIDAKTGRKVADTRDHPAAERRAWFSPEAAEKVKNHQNPVILVHNHPGSSYPSAADCIKACTRENVAGSVVVCHDGTVYNIEPLHAEGIEKAYEKVYNEVASLGLNDEQTAAIAFSRLEKMNAERQWFKVTRQ